MPMITSQKIADLILKIPGVTGCYVLGLTREGPRCVRGIEGIVAADALASFGASAFEAGDLPDASFHFVRGGQKWTWSIDALVIATSTYGVVVEFPSGHPSHKSLRRSLSRIAVRVSKATDAA